ncbi:MAG: hypothetical protein AB7S99_00230 [Pseudodonghicola sp.]
MPFLFSLLYIAAMSLSVVGFISSTADEGDVLNIGLCPNAWGIVTVFAAVLAVGAHVNMNGRMGHRTPGAMFALSTFLYMIHGLVFLAFLVPSALIGLAILAGGANIGYVAALIAVAVLAIPMTSLGWSLTECFEG